MNTLYNAVDVLKSGKVQTVGASDTAMVSNLLYISAEDSKLAIIKLKVSGVSVTTGITAKLQDAYDGSTWEDVGTDSQVAITADGEVQINFNYEDTNSRLLWPTARIVITTGAGDAVQVDKAYMTKRG